MNDFGELGKAQLIEMCDQIIENNLIWFDNHGIHLSAKTNCYILSRKPHSLLNHWNKLTNGLVISKSGEIWSFPMEYMPTYGEDGDFFISASDLEEKLDGHLISLCFPTKSIKKPCWHTKNSISTSTDDLESGEDKEIFNSLSKMLKNINYNWNDAQTTLVFELVDGSKKIKYSDIRKGLYLIGGRKLATNDELTSEELDATADRLRLPRPEVWNSVKSWLDIKEIYDEIRKNKIDFEGFIIRDYGYGTRRKLINQRKS